MGLGNWQLLPQGPVARRREILDDAIRADNADHTGRI